MSIPKAYIRTKQWYERERPVYKCFERHTQPRIEELDLHKEVFGMAGYRQEEREISFLKHISRTTNRKVRNTTVDKIIAKRDQFTEPEYERNKTIRDLIIAHGLTILKLELPPDTYDLKKMEKTAIRYFMQQRNKRAEEEYWPEEG